MDAYIPKADCQQIENEILEGLSESPFVDSIIVNSTKEFYPREDKRRYHAIARNTLEIFALPKKKEFFLMCNSNKVAWRIEHLGMMLDYIKSHPECGCVSYNPLDTQRSPRHVSIGFSIMREKAIKNITFKGIDKTCQCLIFCSEMRSNGWEVSYVGPKIKCKGKYIQQTKENL